MLNAANQAVPNRLFAGCQYPEKLESYAHRTAAPGSGVTLSADLRGTWCAHYDAFKGIAQVGPWTRGSPYAIRWVGARTWAVAHG